MSKLRKYLSASGLLSVVRKSFSKIADARIKKSRDRGTLITQTDCLMSGLAVFGLKCASLLQFEEQCKKYTITRNLNNLYGVVNTPSDTQMRKRLDIIEPGKLRQAFKQVFALAQRGKALEEFVFDDNHYLVSIDGTGQFSSEKVHCENCCEKHHKDGSVSFYHQMLGAVIVHPKQKIVIPLAPEPITKQDGANKNDCERNAAKRLLCDLRREHPHLKIIITEDALSSNAPHIRLLQELNMRFILGVKPDDHKYLFEWVNAAHCEEYVQTDLDGTMHRFKFINHAPLNDANFQLRINFLEHWETKANGKEQHFTWVTDFQLSKDNVYKIMRGGRARWRIENETFNTLKNQGYHFEHNYGHGNKNLCSVFTMLMMLAFLIDQIQELCCGLFQAARDAVSTKRNLWEHMRTIIDYFEFKDWAEFFNKIINTGKIPYTNST